MFNFRFNSYPYFSLYDRVFWIVFFVSFFLFLLIGSLLAQEQEVVLRVTNSELAIIGDALGTQPFTKVAPLLNKLHEQFAAQQQKAADVPPKK